MESSIEYSNNEIIIVWKPSLCTHCEICVNGLPNVFQPKVKPWIKPEGATTQEMIKQVFQCPSGALSFFINNEKEIDLNKLKCNALNKRFELEVEGQLAFIQYDVIGKNTICLTHTQVPKALEGKGYGSSILLKTLNYIKNNNYVLAPLCPFVRKYLTMHPEWKSILASGYNV